MKYNTMVYIGIDFSGSRYCGDKIWIAKTELDKKGGLVLRECMQLRSLPQSSSDRKTCLPVLVNFIASQKMAIVGCDFPFGIPRELVEETTWEQFISSFPERYASPEEFKQRCFQSLGCEAKRRADQEARTPFSPYNLRLYLQTYYGIRDVLHPLVTDSRASVLPMQPKTDGKPIVVEVCPSSTLRRLDMHQGYKGKGEGAERQRGNIIDTLEERGMIRIDIPEIRQKIIKDKEGDALDSVVAAFAAYSALTNRVWSNPKDIPEESREDYMLEGYVYGWKDIIEHRNK